MKRIIIENFGPVKKVDLSLDNNYNIIIGQQASGKSTISKAVYFCSKVKDYLIEYATTKELLFSVHENEIFVAFIKHLRRKFMGCFGTTKHMNPFFIKMYYDEKNNMYILIKLNSHGYVDVFFSEKIKEEIIDLLNNSRSIYAQFDAVLQTLMDRYKTQTHVVDLVEKQVHGIFNDDTDVLYIPAGRILLSTLSEQLTSVKTNELDLPMQEFVDIIRGMRADFSIRINDIVTNYTKTVTGQINNANVNRAIQIIQTILKGEYVCDKDGEKIFFDEDHWVKLMYSSSGQQESLWILMIMFSYILRGRKAFIILEEPEAHLFPEAQKHIVEMIALFCNSTNSSVCITTHSPYVLTSLNLLIHSYLVENKYDISAKGCVVPKQFRVNPETVMANMIRVQDGQSDLIAICNDYGMIDAYQIDQISEIINEETSKLFDLEIDNEDKS